MKRIFLKLSSAILTLAIVVTSLTTTVLAHTDYNCYTVELGEIVNPIYADIKEENSSVFSLTPKKYYSTEQEFNPELYTSDSNAVVVNLREAMVEREVVLDIYYTDTADYSSNVAALLKNWCELAFAETENTNEGDYLRYVWGGFLKTSVTITKYGTDYYYHIPLKIAYYTTKAQEEVFDTELKRVIDSFGFNEASTQRQKSDKIYEYITEHVSYDDENLEDDSYTLKYSAYAALINKTAVCQGYATLFYRMARECGLETRVITGQSRGENHAWNIVKIGSYYYYLDSTWDAGKNKYNYYLKGSSSFTVGHTPEDKFFENAFTQKYPISATDMNLNDDGLSDYFEYYTYMGDAYITAYIGNDANVIVPAQIEGYPVYSVNGGTFSHMPNIKTITFSEGIRRMGSCVIEHCENLKQVNYPSTMELVYEKNTDMAKGGYTEVPMYCPALEKVTVAEGNPYMRVVDGIIYSADGKGVILCVPKYDKTKVTILDGVEDIAPNAFYGCDNLEEISMPNTVKMIGYWAFCTSNNLKKVNISENCEFIGQFAFNSTAVKSIHIPASMETIMGSAFGTANLTEITVDSENENFYMQSGALINYNSEFDNRTILDYEIDNEATVFTVPEDVFQIEQYAFYNAENLKRVIIPNSVEYIGSSAFENCDSLTHFAFPEGIETVNDYVLIDCDNIMSVIIPDSVTEIGNMLVYGNDGYTIYGEKGSIAEEYATNNQIKFKEMDEFVCEGGHTVQKQYIDEYTYHNVCTVCGDCAKTQYLGDINSVAQFAEIKKYNYTGREIKPSVAQFEYDGNVFKQNVDYKLIGYYDNVNVGFGYAKIEGIGDYAGVGYIYFEITPMDISSRNVKLEYTSTIYDGYEKRPNVEIEGLREFEDYEVNYSNNIKVGTATVTINAFGNYVGKIVKTFSIGLSATSKVSAELYGYDDVKVSWKRVAGADGYYVHYKKSGDSAYTKKGTTTALSYNIANLADNAKYIFKVVAYYIKDGVKKSSANYKTVTAATLRNLSAPSKVTLSLYGYDDVKVSWSKVSYAEGYYVYYKKSTAKSYTYAGKTTSTSFKKKDLSDGIKYTFKVVPYGLSDSKVILDDSYKTATITTLRNLSAPSKVTLSLYGYDDVKVSWSKVSYAKGYCVYYKKSNAKSYTYAGKTTSTSFKKKDLSDGIKYTFKVVPYGVSGSKVILDDSYKTASIYTLKKISTPKVTKSSGKVKVSWTNISGESGYQISQSTSKSKTKIVFTYSTTSGKSKTIKATKKKTYYYKVRAYKTVNGKKIYGPWSSVKKYKLK